MLARISVKKPYTVIVGILLVIALGVISFINMTTDLLPSMDLPYVIVYTTYTGATPESVESDVTRPLEAAFSTLTDVKNVSSTSSENLSLVVMEFEAGADMNTAMIEINSDVEQVRGGWDDDVGTPVIMKLNPDMLPVMTSTVSLEDADLLELSDYVEDELISRFEAVDGVARVTASGILTQQVDITIEQNRIDAINNAILREIDDELADAELELRDAQEELSSGKSKLAKEKKKAYAQIDEGLSAIKDGKKQLSKAIEGINEQRAELAEQRKTPAEMLVRLQALASADEAEIERIMGVGAKAKELTEQLAAAQAALQAIGGQAGNAEGQLAAAQESLAEELALKQRLENYIQNLTESDKEALQETIRDLSDSLAAGEASYNSMRTEYGEVDTERIAAKEELDRIAAEIAARTGMGPGSDPTPSPGDEIILEPVDEPSAEPTEDPTEGLLDEIVIESTEAPTEEPTDAPSDEPTEESTEAPTENPADEVIETLSPEVEDTPVPEESASNGRENLSPDDAETPAPEQTEAPKSEEPETPDPALAREAAPASNGAEDEPSTEAMDGEAVNQAQIDAISATKTAFAIKSKPTPAPEPGSAPDVMVFIGPSQEPAAASEPAPDVMVLIGPTAQPTKAPTPKPTARPTKAPTPKPTAKPTKSPTHKPTPKPTKIPTQAPTAEPTQTPTQTPTAEPTLAPTAGPAEDLSEKVILDASETLASRLLGGSALAEGEHSLEELQEMYAKALARYQAADARANALQARLNDLRETQNERQSALENAQEALRLLDAGEVPTEQLTQAQAQLESCNGRIVALNGRIAAIQTALEASGGQREALAAQVAELQQQLTELMTSDDYISYSLLTSEKGLDVQIAELQAAIDTIDAADAQMAGMLEKLYQGIIPGGLIDGIDEDTDLDSAQDQLLAARSKADKAFSEAESEFKSGEDELAEAWKEFTEQRDDALENAGIDGIITTENVSGILGSQNLDLPAGYVSNADDRYLVSVGTEFASIEELRNIKLFSIGMKTVDDVRLFDVARVEISDNSEDLFTFVNGENGIMLSFEKQSTASTAEVAENISVENERLMAENGRLKITEMMNQGDYINLIVDSVLDNLVYGGGLAILVLLLFLLDWRPTLIVALSIPTSVVVAFVCMYFANITLNVMSLSGLALGVGMLVDNSIVSIENIYRLRDEEHLPILTASIRGVNQVAGALFSSTLTTICVFLPVIFVEGMARDLFTDMGLTIAFSLLASLVVAMTLVPTAAATLFKNRKEKPHRFFSAFQRGYVKLLSGALRFKPLVLLVAVGLLAYSGYRVMDMGISFMPSVNSEQMSASLEFEDPDMPDSERESAAISIMEEIMQVEGVKDVSLSGSSTLSLMGGGSGYTYYVLVDTEAGRKNADIAAEMQQRAASYADGERSVFSAQASTMDLSAFAGQGITVDIFGDDIQKLRDASKEIAEICAQVDGAVNIDDGSEEAEPKLAIVVDKELASDNSLSVAQVYQYVAQRLYGKVSLTDATLDGRDYTLYVVEDKNLNISPDELADMEIEVEGTTETHFVRIGDIAEIVDGESMSSIRRDNQTRTASVSFEVAEGHSANLVSRDLEEKLAAYQPPEGIEIGLSGENESVMGYMKDLLTMLAVAVLFIFLIMVAQFQSFKSPIIVMFTIPLAFTGGLLALIITGMDLSIIAMVGFLVLSGVVVNNGIVFIDSVNQMRINGMEKREALIETGRIRLRPILMTALTTILGMSTMALAQGMGAEMMQPMAVVTIGGLTYATLMTLFVVPVLYDLLNGKKMKAREIEMMKEAAGMHREGFDDDAPASASGGSSEAAGAALPAASAGAEGRSEHPEAANSSAAAQGATPPAQTPPWWRSANPVTATANLAGGAGRPIVPESPAGHETGIHGAIVPAKEAEPAAETPAHTEPAAPASPASPAKPLRVRLSRGPKGRR